MKYDQFTRCALNAPFHTFLLVRKEWSHCTSNQMSQVGLLQTLLSIGLWSIGTFSFFFFYVYDVGERCLVKTTHLWLAEVVCGCDGAKATQNAETYKEVDWRLCASSVSERDVTVWSVPPSGQGWELQYVKMTEPSNSSLFKKEKCVTDGTYLINTITSRGLLCLTLLSLHTEQPNLSADPTVC